MSPLERRYRRLLKAYPLEYRKLREAEMIGTLLDAAEPDQRRPRILEAVDLMFGGLRQRMGVNASSGFAEGLRLVFPLALVLVTVLAATIRVGGLDTAPRIQPYVYAWLFALVVWAVHPLSGRVLTVAAALFTVRIAAMWSWYSPDVLTVSVIGALAAYAAVAAPSLSARTDGTAQLWDRWPARSAAALVTAAVAVLAVYDQVHIDWPGITVAAAALLLALLGAVMLTRGHGPAVLWTAAMLVPPALIGFDFVELSSYQQPYGLWPVLWSDRLGYMWNTVIVFSTALLAITLIFAAVRGRTRTIQAAATLSRSLVGGAAVMVIVLETAAGVWAPGVLFGCAALVVATLGVGWIPRWSQVALLAAGSLAVLSDGTRAERYENVEGLYALAALGLLAIAFPARPRSANRWAPVLWTVTGAAVVAATMAKERNFDQMQRSVDMFSLAEFGIVILAPLAFVAALGAAIASAGERSPRSLILTVVSLTGLACFLLVSRDPFLITIVVGVGTAIVVVGGLAARVAFDRFHPTAA